MATIKDVARASGVSIATVSYVINGKNALPLETREKVLRAARELNYHPNAVAQSLLSKRMNTIGVLSGVVHSDVVLDNEYTASILQGIVMASAKRNNNVTIFTTPWKSSQHSSSYWADRRTDGMVVIAPAIGSDMIPAMAAIGQQMTVISFPAERYGVASVDVDNALGIRLAVKHLLTLGHTRIAHLAGAGDMYSAILRREAFRAVMAEAGLATPDEYLGPGSYEYDASYVRTRELLRLPNKPTAIVAANDTNALAALQAAWDLGVDVPRRLSVVGFDDMPEARHASPALTTLRQPLRLVGETAAELLLRQLSGEAIPRIMHLVAPTLIERDSTAPP